MFMYVCFCMYMCVCKPCKIYLDIFLSELPLSNIYIFRN